MQITITNAPESISLKALDKTLNIDFAKMPEASLNHVFAYGIRQILNDAMASAKTDAEREAAANKRLDNLMTGTLRASPVREGNPVRRRALELAYAKVVVHPAFIAWAQKAGIKVTHKDAVKAAREQAAKWVAVEGNKFMVQAAKDVEEAKANLPEADELTLDL